ncbi:hypothetical protein WA171_000097 [Blastocystis sp. BT1]
MSSFRKFTPGSSLRGDTRKTILPGTKSWLYGQSLLSTGCSDLDNACGAGISLGSLMVLSEEVGIRQANTIQKLFISQGIHSKQRVLILSSESKSQVMNLLSKLPTLRKAPTVSKDSQPKLTAWNYSKYGKNQAEVIPFCQSLDLSEYETDSSLLSSISYSIVSETDEKALLTRVLTLISSFCSLCKEQGSVGRIVLNLSDILADDTRLQIALFSRIKILLHNSNTVAVATIHPEINGKTLLKYGDCVIALQPWRGITPPDEFRETSGLLQVIRLPSHLSLYTHNKSIFIYGIKRSMHSLHLSELRIPPLGCSGYSGVDDLF